MICEGNTVVVRSSDTLQSASAANVERVPQPKNAVWVTGHLWLQSPMQTLKLVVIDPQFTMNHVYPHRPPEWVPCGTR
jgi:hypothetical protein